MEFLNDITKNIWIVRIFWSLITIAICYLVYKIFSNTLTSRFERDKKKVLSNKKSQTYIKLLRNIIRYIIIIITVLVILNIFGIDVSSMLAGLGIISVIIGLAIQDFLKDIIRGSSILSDNYFSVGDVVKYNGIEAKVLVLGLKTTKIQDLATSNIISIANRNIEEIELVSNLIYVRVPIPYEVDIDSAEKAIEDIMRLAEEYDTVDKCRYLGITEYKDSSIEYLLEVKGNPANKLQRKRDTLRAIKVGLSNNNIEIPYTQIDIHQK